MRVDFFGAAGYTRWNQRELAKAFPSFEHAERDIRNRAGLADLLGKLRPEMIVHAAAQPSHDLAASRPFDDFDVNAGGTLNVLEATRRLCPEAVFVHMSTNKVYGAAPNEIPLVERGTRWEDDDPRYPNGIPEEFRI